MQQNRTHPVYLLIWSFSRWFFVTCFRFSVQGVHRVPREGGFILASNHASFFDPPALGCGFPRPVHYFARRTLFKGFFTWLLPRLNTIPVDRDGASDVTALKTVFRTLKEGHGIIFFPEGTRSPDGLIHGAKKGIGMIACKAGVPVVPARVFGTYEAFSRHHRVPRFGHPVRVVYGSPLPASVFDPGRSDPDRYQKAADRILAAVAAISEPRNPVV